jgi:glycerophosphoryl diester phosphodiesterase
VPARLINVIRSALSKREAPRAGRWSSPLVLGHRGDSAHAPENTHAAFERCVRLGVGIELDVSQTSDGELVVLHDDTVDRTTTGTGKVSEKIGSEVLCLEAGRWFGESFEGERVPTLEDVIQRYANDVLLDIELKTSPDPQSLAIRVTAALRRYGVLDRVVISSFDPFILGAIAEHAPEVLRGQIVGTLRDTNVPRYQRWLLRSMALLSVSRPDLLILEDEITDPRILEWARRRGLEVWVWVVNDPVRAKDLIDHGARGIISDDPGRIVEALTPIHTAG